MELHRKTDNRQAFRLLDLAAGLSAFVFLFAPTAQAEDTKRDPTRPNVIVMMADDLGYADLSCYGSKTLRTPALDTLAGQGARLTSFYAGCTICTPSRIALLTGSYPARMGWQGGVVGWKIDGNNGLDPQALTMGEVFQQAGYATGLVGKWHLGDTPGLLPMDQGFDEAYYIKRSNNQTKKLWRGEELIEDPFDNRLLTEKFTAEAIKFIKADRDEPFLLYLPFTAPHFPAQAHPDWKGKSQLGAYGDVVEELDSRVGEILQALNDQGNADETIILFTSDNGPDPSQRRWASATPYRGLKWSSLEGGNRVPCIVRWPKAIPGNRVIEEPIAAIDVLPTLAEACGIHLTERSDEVPPLDGVSIWSTLVGKSENVHARSELLYWHGWGTLQAIRVGNWKLYLDQIEEIPGSAEHPVLVDLAADPEEQTDLSEQHPDKVRSMTDLALQRLKEIEAHSIPLANSANDQIETLQRGKWLK